MPRSNRETRRDVWRRLIQDRLTSAKRADRLGPRLVAFRDAIVLQPRRLAEETRQDLRYGLRMLGKYPAFTIIAVLTLGLGIGANTAIFSIVNKALFRSLPVREPEQLVAVNNATGHGRSFPIFSYLDYRDLRDRNDVLSGLVAYTMAPAHLSHDGINERVWGYVVSGNYFSVLGVRPLLGRLIAPEDDRAAGAHPVVVLSHRFWRQRFGADSQVVGRDIIVNGRAFRIIGVAPPGFFGLEKSFVADVWFPLMMHGEIRPGREWLNDRSRETFFLAGRLKDGISAAQAQERLRAVAFELAREHRSDGRTLAVLLTAPGLFGTAGRRPILGFAAVLMAVVSLVLLLVCTNLANLLLARGIGRRREIAVRLAIGAGRVRLVRQLLTESFVLALLGGACGLAFAFWLIRAAGSFRPPMDVPLSTELGVDARVFLFTAAISVATTFAFGLLPAWYAVRHQPVSALTNEPVLGGRVRVRSALVVAQVALSFVLLIGAGLVLRGLHTLQATRLGFSPQQAVKLSFDLDLQGYSRERGRVIQRQLLDRVRALTAVERAGLGTPLPLEIYVPMVRVGIEGQPLRPDEEAPLVGAALAGQGFFGALGTRLLRGRDFSERDDEKSPRVAVVNETFAGRFWPGEDALGKRFSLSSLGSAPIQVVGIVEDGKYRTLTEAPQPFAFMPLTQSYSGSITLVARSTANPADLMAAVRRELAALDPHLPAFDAMPLEEHLRLPFFPVRLAATALGSFGILSLMLAAIGIFGVVSYRVSERTREIGIRMALGARGSAVLQLVLRLGMQPVAVGIAFGLLASWASTRLMTDVLFGVYASDPVVFAGTTVLLVVTALLACYLPARRAVRLDPLAALRHE